MKICCRSASGQRFLEGFLQDLFEPRRHRAAEQRAPEGDIAGGMHLSGIHPELESKTDPNQSNPGMVDRPRDLADECSELTHDLADRRFEATPCLFETLSVL
jgi:hypothetical protein